MSQELNIKKVFKAEQVRLKPYYDLTSYEHELVYARDVLDIHIERIDGVLKGEWLPERTNEEFGALVAEVRGLSRTDSTESEEPQPRREAVERFYEKTMAKLDDPKDRMILCQCIASMDDGEELNLGEMYHDDFNAALTEYKEAEDAD